MKLLIYASILLFAPVQHAEATDQQTVRVRATQPSVVTVHEPAQDRRKGKIRRAVRARATQAARGAVRLTGWLLNTDDHIPQDQERAREAAGRKTEGK